MLRTGYPPSICWEKLFRELEKTFMCSEMKANVQSESSFRFSMSCGFSLFSLWTWAEGGWLEGSGVFTSTHSLSGWWNHYKTWYIICFIFFFTWSSRNTVTSHLCFYSNMLAASVFMFDSQWRVTILYIFILASRISPAESLKFCLCQGFGDGSILAEDLVEEEEAELILDGGLPRYTTSDHRPVEEGREMAVDEERAEERKPPPSWEEWNHASSSWARSEGVRRKANLVPWIG